MTCKMKKRKTKNKSIRKMAYELKEGAEEIAEGLVSEKVRKKYKGRKYTF